MSNGDSDKQTCVQNIIKEIKSLENRIGGDEEAVQSLLLLGGQPFESLLDQYDYTTVALKRPNNYGSNATFPEVSVNDLGVLLGDVPSSTPNINNRDSNGGHSQANATVFRSVIVDPSVAHLLSDSVELLLDEDAPDRPASAPACLSSDKVPDGLLPSRTRFMCLNGTALRATLAKNRLSRSRFVSSCSAASTSGDLFTRSLDDLRSATPTVKPLESFFVKRRVENENISDCDRLPTTVVDSTKQSSDTIDVFGKDLPLVDSPDVNNDDPKRVFVVDVFQNFFSKRHFDEFRSILEENSVQTLPIRPRGVGETLETITVDELNRLLNANQARRDGFVQCLTLNSYSASGVEMQTDTKVINRQERTAGELTSGIRTRRAENQDIGYVELDGTPLPALLIDGIHYVRVVDVLRLIVGNDDRQMSGQHLANNLRRLKHYCQCLSLTLSHCSPNDKARLVIVANSFHNNSCLVMRALDTPKLVAHDRNCDERCNGGGGKRFQPSDECNTSISNGLKKRPRFSHDVSPTTSCSTTTLYTESEFDDLIDDSVSSSPIIYSRPPSAAPSNASLTTVDCTPSNCSRTLPFRGRDGTDRRKIGHLLAELKPLRIILQRSEPLPLIVCSISTTSSVDKRGPTGYYLDHLFVGATAQCIRCQLCNRFFDIRGFIVHFHSQPVVDGVLMMYANRRRDNSFEMWRSLNTKLSEFRLNDLTRYVSPLLNRDRQKSLTLKSKMKQQQLMDPTPPMRPADALTPVQPLYRLRANSSSLRGHLPSDTTSFNHRSMPIDRLVLFASYGAADWMLGLHGVDERERNIMELYGKSIN